MSFQIDIEKDYLEQERRSLRKTEAEIDKLKQASESMREEQQNRLSQIAMRTQALHVQQEKLDRVSLQFEIE